MTDEWCLELSQFCSIACDLSYSNQETFLALSHNGRLSIFEPDDSERAVAWLKALHYMQDPSVWTRILKTRLHELPVTEGPLSYDIAWALRSGIINQTEARQQMRRSSITSRGGMFSNLHHNTILKELGLHLTYTIVDEKDKVCWEAYIDEVSFGPRNATCVIAFSVVT